MSKTRATQPKPILNASLPPQFRQFRLALAREPGHPEGDAEVAYIIVAPLDSEDRIDAGLWREHRDACRVVRQRPNEQDEHGHLVHRPGGGWGFHYDGDETSRPTRSAIILRTNTSSSANMSRSTRAAKCTPIG